MFTIIALTVCIEAHRFESVRRRVVVDGSDGTWDSHYKLTPRPPPQLGLLNERASLVWELETG